MSAHRIGPGLISVQPVMNLEPSWLTLTDRGPSGGVEIISIIARACWPTRYRRTAAILGSPPGICARTIITWPSAETPVDASIILGGNVLKGTGRGFPSR